jgi:hypothetical protein
MPFINLPPTVSHLFWNQDKRIARLETAYRFNAPCIDFSTNVPTNPRQGDIYYATNINRLVYWNGTQWYQLTQSTYTP